VPCECVRFNRTRSLCLYVSHNLCLRRRSCAASRWCSGRCAACRSRTRSLLQRRLDRVSFKGARRRKLAQLVPDHLLGHIHGNKLLSVVHGNGVPIISGTIVERRDQVFTTFFSFRVFSPSTFSRRWPSTNGPFFSERAIDSLFLHSAQAAPRRAPHLLESSYRSRNAVRPRAKRAHKPRALRIRNPLHNHCPTRLAQLVEHRLRRRHNYFPCWAHRLGAFCRCAFYHSLGRPRRTLCRCSSQRCPPSCCSCRSCCSHRVCSRRAALPSPPSFQRLLRQKI